MKDDIEWLEQLVKRDKLEDDYKLVYEEKELTGGVWSHGISGRFSYLWGIHATDDDTIYIKIDDDLVWIDDYAIPYMVTSLLAHPEAFNIQSNVINSRFTHWFHHATGAILPFLPEEHETNDFVAKATSWRPSEFPPYPVKFLPPGSHSVLEQTYAPPYSGHRWLPLPDTAEYALRTPFGNVTELPKPQTKDTHPLPRWTHAAIEHMSLLHHIEQGDVSSYPFGGLKDGLWDTSFQHYNINFMAFWGKTLAKRPFWDESNQTSYLDNDEYALTVDVPLELKMPVLVDTRALVSHYAFHSGKQRERLLTTDILDRYRLMANDLYCDAGNQKRPLTGKLR